MYILLLCRITALSREEKEILSNARPETIASINQTTISDTVFLVHFNTRIILMVDFIL